MEQTVLAQTADDTSASALDRAWFFTLSHTGLRISELLNLRLADLDLTGGCMIVQGKNRRDRVVYLTPTIYDATVREQFQAAMANIEGITVSGWPQPGMVLTAAGQPVTLKSDSV